MSRPIRALALVLAVTACDRRGTSLATRGGTAPRVAINEVMANPRAATDERGEWFEIVNLDSKPVDLQGWVIGSGNDRGAEIDKRVIIQPGGFAVLARNGARSANGGITSTFAYGQTISLGNTADWLALRMADGTRVDSVAWTSSVRGASRALTNAGAPHADLNDAVWTTSRATYGDGDRGTPGASNEQAVPPSAPLAEAPGAGSTPASTTPRAASTSSSTGPIQLRASTSATDSSIVIRILDVGQGDAILIENGGTRVLIDGGPDVNRLGRLMDQFAITGATVDAVILTHEHYDHASGLRELFRTRRRVTVRYVFDNGNSSSNVSLAQLRDSVRMRASRGELAARDTDDPCGTGAPECTITMGGGARLHVLRPDPQGIGPNNRSAAVKIVAADSARFSMWLAGDAEQQAIRWFDATEYDRAPGMRSMVLKGDHHGSCDGISPRYLDLVRPEIVALSLAATNDYGYVHSQTLDLLETRRIPWYRTDQNGTITITVPSAGKYAITTERGGASLRGPSDRRARECGEEQLR